MRVIFAGGGTAGHINPAIAIADYISKKESCLISFCGGKGNIEETLVPKLGYPIDVFPLKGLSRGKDPASLIHNIKAVYEMESAFAKSKRIIREKKPDIVIGTGGYASFPMVLAAAKSGVKTAILEANAVAGVATKHLAPKVDCVLLAYGVTAKEIKAKRTEETGSPVRAELIGCRKKGKRTIFDNDLPIVLSFWCSVGAKYMNEKMVDYLGIVSREKRFNHIHASGKDYFEQMKNALRENGAVFADNVILTDYIYNMGEIMSQADLVLCRSGGTLAELCAAGMPSVLVPSPFVAENHQERNAKVLENAGAAVLLKERELTSEGLYTTIEDLVLSSEKLDKMSENALKLGHPDALSHIYETLKSIIR